MNHLIRSRILPAILSATWLLFAPSTNAEGNTVYIGGAAIDYTLWSDDERAKNIAIRTFEGSKAVSNHLVLVNGHEPKHYHDRHDLTATVLSGTSILHLKDKDIRLTVGTVAIIPRGTFHWTENISAEGSIVLTSFSPAFDGKDRRIVE